MRRAVSLQHVLLQFFLLSCVFAGFSAAAGFGYDPFGSTFGYSSASGAVGGGGAAGGFALGGSAACVTPSVLLPRSRSDAAACNSELTVPEMTGGEWADLKWGTVEVMCRRSNQTMVFYMKNDPRFGWNPLKSVASAFRRFSGSVDMRTFSQPLRPLCECDHRTFPPFYAEVFKKEQYLTGVKIQSAPRRVYEMLGEETPCEPPRVWGSPLGLGSIPLGPSPSGGYGRPFEFQELRRCLWKIELPYKPQVFAARNEVMVTLPGSTDNAAASALHAAAAAAAGAAGQQFLSPSAGPRAAGQGHLTLSLPPACHMQEVDQQLRVWIRGAAAAAPSPAAAAAPSPAGLVRPEHSAGQQMYEVHIEVVSPFALQPDALYYHRKNTVGDFVLAVERERRARDLPPCVAGELTAAAAAAAAAVCGALPPRLHNRGQSEATQLQQQKHQQHAVSPGLISLALFTRV
ncbi:hypothetical protein Efla_001958 [Eimeria flavescens]